MKTKKEALQYELKKVQNKIDQLEHTKAKLRQKITELEFGVTIGSVVERNGVRGQVTKFDSWGYPVMHLFKKDGTIGGYTRTIFSMYGVTVE